VIEPVAISLRRPSSRSTPTRKSRFGLSPTSAVVRVQAFALPKKLLEKIPLVGLGVEAFNTARDARLAYEKEGQLADLITSLWTIVPRTEAMAHRPKLKVAVCAACGWGWRNRSIRELRE
jgi:hypothetical protein